MHGMLDPDILTQMMRAGGIRRRADPAMMPGDHRGGAGIYQTSVPDLRDKTCPGVVPLLDDLRERGTVLALVTGNLTRIGWQKLERAGLDHYFRFGAFGEMAPTRGGLARLAIEQARREGLIDGTRISLIGDATQDVLAARENGIRVDRGAHRNHAAGGTGSERARSAARRSDSAGSRPSSKLDKYCPTVRLPAFQLASALHWPLH